MRSQLTDPLSGRIEWITGAYPPLKYKKPQICLNKLGKPFRKDIGHGDQGEIASYRFNISLFVAGKVPLEIDTVTYAGPSLLQYLSSLIDRAMKTARMWFHTNRGEWFVDIEVTTGQDLPYKEMLDEYRYDTNILIQLIEFY